MERSEGIRRAASVLGYRQMKAHAMYMAHTLTRYGVPEKDADDVLMLIRADKKRFFDAVEDVSVAEELAHAFHDIDVVGISADFRSIMDVVSDLDDPCSVVLPDGSDYIGQLKDGVPSGIGEIRGKDGSVFYGDVSGGKRNGFGVMRMADKSLYIGEFREDFREYK